MTPDDLATWIKPLVWRRDTSNTWDSGHYAINQEWPRNNGPFTVDVSRGAEVGIAVLGKFHTLELAKAAAQADYTTRILSAFDLTPTDTYDPASPEQRGYDDDKAKSDGEE